MANTDSAFIVPDQSSSTRANQHDRTAADSNLDAQPDPTVTALPKPLPFEVSWRIIREVRVAQLDRRF